MTDYLNIPFPRIWIERAYFRDKEKYEKNPPIIMQDDDDSVDLPFDERAVAFAPPAAAPSPSREDSDSQPSLGRNKPKGAGVVRSNNNDERHNEDSDDDWTVASIKSWISTSLGSMAPKDPFGAHLYVASILDPNYESDSSVDNSKSGRSELGSVSIRRSVHSTSHQNSAAAIPQCIDTRSAGHRTAAARRSKVTGRREQVLPRVHHQDDCSSAAASLPSDEGLRIQSSLSHAAEKEVRRRKSRSAQTELAVASNRTPASMVRMTRSDTDSKLSSTAPSVVSTATSGPHASSDGASGSTQGKTDLKTTGTSPSLVVSKHSGSVNAPADNSFDSSQPSESTPEGNLSLLREERNDGDEEEDLEYRTPPKLPLKSSFSTPETTVSLYGDNTSDRTDSSNEVAVVPEKGQKGHDRPWGKRCLPWAVFVFVLLLVALLVPVIVLASDRSSDTVSSLVATAPPSAVLSLTPSGLPSSLPSASQSSGPSTSPSFLPTTVAPTEGPSNSPSINPTDSPTKATMQTRFYAIGDVPYKESEKGELEEHILALPDDAEFLIHVGDIRHGDDEIKCTLKEYKEVRDILLQSPVPVFIIPGDNEWNDCPNQDEGMAFWFDVFDEFDKNWDHNFEVVRHPLERENFYFVHKKTLFFGLNMVGGSIFDTDAFSIQMEEEFNWVKEVVEELVVGKSDASSVVFFGHAYPRRIHDSFFVPLQEYVEDSLGEVPMLYLNGDFHYFEFEKDFLSQSNFQRLQVDFGTDHPPLQVSVSIPGSGKFDAMDTFSHDRLLSK